MMRSAVGLAALLPLMVAAAAPLASPAAFVERIYHADVADPTPFDEATIYAPPLLALIRRDAAIGQRDGGVNILDWDPLCSCQDEDGMEARFSLRRTGAASAIADVRLAFPSDRRRLTLKLVRLPAGWRIADIVTKDSGSLVSLLRRGLAHAR